MSQTSTGKPLLSAIQDIKKYYNKDGIMTKYIVYLDNGMAIEEDVEKYKYRKPMPYREKK